MDSKSSVEIRGMKERVLRFLNVLLLVALVFSIFPSVSIVAYADETESEALSVVYKQEDGYEAYQGWQDAPWEESIDPWYNSSGGTTRKGYPAWSLVSPLSRGVTGYDNNIITGDNVSIITDMNKSKTDGISTLDNPFYYYNIILPSYDVTASELKFTFNYVGAGGVSFSSGGGSGFYDGHGGIAITTTDDPSLWENEDYIVWEGDRSNTAIAATSDNWWKNVICTINMAETQLEADTTYYLVVRNGTAGYHARLFANICFEFNTNVGGAAIWEGNEASTAYGREQGNGGTKLGIIDPAPSDVKVDLTKLDTCWYNHITTPLALGESNEVSFTVHADGSGSNWQSLSNWLGSCKDKVLIYDTDPTAGGGFDTSSLVPVASYATENLVFTLANEERDWPSFDGLKITANGLKADKVYYLV